MSPGRYPCTMTTTASTVTAEWHHTPDGADSADSSGPIDSSHKGPVMSYLQHAFSLVGSPVANGRIGVKVDNVTHWRYRFGTVQDYEDEYRALSSTWLFDTSIANDGKLILFTLQALTRRGYARFEITARGGNSTSPFTVSFPGAYADT
ncbi:hypothetical protein IW262DRAFT_1478763 [Armillaria fumosa]|nr:hypothetical protein IW262DRAFT_1478763 [Armillaria fumosa]